MAIFDELGHLTRFLYDAHQSGRHHLSDLYELVQYAGSVHLTHTDYSTSVPDGHSRIRLYAGIQRNTLRCKRCAPNQRNYEGYAGDGAWSPACHSRTVLAVLPFSNDS
jgi:Vacuolar protein sorting-associated protein 35